MLLIDIFVLSGKSYKFKNLLVLFEGYHPIDNYDITQSSKKYFAPFFILLYFNCFDIEVCR